ncbi:hypothetical protein [Glycomyces sp. MUSA5-2]|uniref:hypothetical protein n=1 Tax=Glycomyces sp. MUSA5-2 TaxID=2053002 RepID=UPI00300A76F3
MGSESTGAVVVRYKAGYSVTQMVFGGFFLVLGLFFAGIPGSTGNGFMVMFAGLMLLLLGVLAYNRPYCTLEPAEGALYMHPLVGGRGRAIGAPRGQRLYLDGSDIMCAVPNGRERRLNLGFAANAEDLDRLKAALHAGAGNP